MKKQYRLLKNEDFKTVLDKHTGVSRENISIYHKRNELNHCRVGVSVSSKIGNSVVRHKIKRQIVDMIDRYLDLNVSIDLVIIVRNKYIKYTYQENYDIVKKVIDNILKKEKINNEK